MTVSDSIFTKIPNSNIYIFIIILYVEKFNIETVYYGVRGVSQIKFTTSDSFLVLYDFD